MGIEYQIRFALNDSNQFDQFVRNQPYFESFDAQLSRYDFRGPKSEKLIGYATFGDDGISFCDNCAEPISASHLLRCLIDFALLHSEKVTIKEP